MLVPYVTLLCLLSLLLVCLVVRQRSAGPAGLVAELRQGAVEVAAATAPPPQQPEPAPQPRTAWIDRPSPYASRPTGRLISLPDDAADFAIPWRTDDLAAYFATPRW